eukprot:scaffold1313_cov406-Prasinococcus_capsulatus_cf.AAC.2
MRTRAPTGGGAGGRGEIRVRADLGRARGRIRGEAGNCMDMVCPIRALLCPYYGRYPPRPESQRSWGGARRS